MAKREVEEREVGRERGRERERDRGQEGERQLEQETIAFYLIMTCPQNASKIKLLIHFFVCSQNTRYGNSLKTPVKSARYQQQFSLGIAYMHKIGLISRLKHLH